MISAPAAVASLLASRPQTQIIAHLFTFSLRMGSVLRFTDWRGSLTFNGNTYLGGRVGSTSQPRILRGNVKSSRGTSIDTSRVTMLEQDGPTLQLIEDGFFDLATYRLERIFRADMQSPWVGPVTRFLGQIASIDQSGRGSAQMTAKSMLNLLDNDFPRQLMQVDCNNTLYDAACGLKRSDYTFGGTVQAGSTKNTVVTDMTLEADICNQGIITFYSGALNGLSYYVQRNLAGGTIYPGYPLLVAPAAGDVVGVSKGCDKSLATCISKFGYNAANFNPPHFRGMPFVPPPTAAF